MESFANDVNVRQYFDEDVPSVSPIFPVSTPSALGYRLPVWIKTNQEISIIDEASIVDTFQQKGSKKNKILISLFVFHAIQEGNISSHFALEDGLSAFFASGFVKDQTLLETRVEVYKRRYPAYIEEAQELEMIIAAIKEDSANEDAIGKFANILENGFAIHIDTQGLFEFDITQID